MFPQFSEQKSGPPEFVQPEDPATFIMEIGSSTDVTQSIFEAGKTLTDEGPHDGFLAIYSDHSRRLATPKGSLVRESYTQHGLNSGYGFIINCPDRIHVMYGIFTYIDPIRIQQNVGQYTIHGSYGECFYSVRSRLFLHLHDMFFLKHVGS